MGDQARNELYTRAVIQVIPQLAEWGVDPEQAAAIKGVAQALATGKQMSAQQAWETVRKILNAAVPDRLTPELQAMRAKQQAAQTAQAVAPLQAKRAVLAERLARGAKRLQALETQADRLEAQARKLGDDARIRNTNKQYDEARGLWAEEKKVADQAKAIRATAKAISAQLYGDPTTGTTGLDGEISALDEQILAAQYPQAAAPAVAQQPPATQPGETIWDKAAPSVVDLAASGTGPRTVTPAQPIASASTADPKLSMAERQQRARMWLNAVKSQGVVEQPHMQPVRPVSPAPTDGPQPPEYDPVKARSIIDTALASAEKALAAGGNWEDQAAALQPLMQQLSPNDLARLARLRDKYRR